MLFQIAKFASLGIAQLLNARMSEIQDAWSTAIIENVPEYAAIVTGDEKVEREFRRSCKKFAVGFAITLDSGGPARLRKNIEDLVKKRMDQLPLAAITSALKQWQRISCQEVSRDAAINGIDATITEGEVEEKFPKENFRVSREMRDEILVYDLFLTKFWAKMVSKCRENAAKI